MVARWVIPLFLSGTRSAGRATRAKFCFRVMPPRPCLAVRDYRTRPRVAKKSRSNDVSGLRCERRREYVSSRKGQSASAGLCVMAANSHCRCQITAFAACHTRTGPGVYAAFQSGMVTLRYRLRGPKRGTASRSTWWVQGIPAAPSHTPTSAPRRRSAGILFVANLAMQRPTWSGYPWRDRKPD